MGKESDKTVSLHKSARRPMRIYLREWLHHSNLTAEQLAEKMDTSKGTISKLENGKQQYSQKWMEQIAYHLNCEVADLLHPPMQPTANELVARLSPEMQQMAMSLLENMARVRNGTDG